MKSVNEVNLTGRLTDIPELRRSRNGFSSCSFTLEIDRKRKNGEECANYIRCKAFGKNADSICGFGQKDSWVTVSGHIETGSYVNRQGLKVYTTDVMADQLTLHGKQDQEAAPQPETGYRYDVHYQDQFDSQSDCSNGFETYDQGDIFPSDWR